MVLKSGFSETQHSPSTWAFLAGDGSAFAWDSARLELVELAPEALQSQNTQALAQELLAWASQESEAHPIKEQWRTLTINVTQVCNLKCLYCAAGGDGTYGQAQKRILLDKALPSLNRLFARLSEGQDFRITFSGGEPLLYPEGIELISSYAQEEARTKNIKLSFSIVTNGTLISKDNLDLLAKYKMDVTVSVDGAPDINKQMRPTAGGGDPTAKLEAGLAHLSANKSRLGSLVLAGVFNAQNPQVLPAYTYYKKWNFDFYDFNFDYYETEATANAIFNNQMSQIASQAFSQGGEAELRKILFFDRYFRHLDQKAYLTHHCGAGQSYAAMDAKGDLYACPWKVGQPQSQVVLGQEQLYQVPKMPPCNTCWAKPLCAGGCRFQHETASDEAMNLYCDRTKHLLKLVFLYYVKGRKYEYTSQTTYQQQLQATAAT